MPSSPSTLITLVTFIKLVTLVILITLVTPVQCKGLICQVQLGLVFFSSSLVSPGRIYKVVGCPHKCWQPNWPKSNDGTPQSAVGTTVMLLVVFLPPLATLPCNQWCRVHLVEPSTKLSTVKRSEAQHSVASYLRPLRLFTANNYPGFCALPTPRLKGCFLAQKELLLSISMIREFR